MKCEKNLMIIRGPSNLRCNPHINPQLEIIYVLQGKMKIKVEQDSFELQKNEITLILPYRIHQFVPENNCFARVFLFPTEMLENIFPNYQRLKLPENKFVLTKEALDYIESILKTGETFDNIYLTKSIFYCLIQQCMKSAVFVENKIATSDAFSKAIEYILENWNEKITLDSVSKYSGISRNSLSMAIKQYCEIGFSQLITNIRLEHAKVMLLESEKNITEIAYDSGFGSLRSFNRSFYAMFQCTPKQYRCGYGIHKV